MKELRPVQERGVDRVREAMRARKRRVLLVAPTSYGKTLVGSEVLRRVIENGLRGLWVTNRIELLRQSAAAIRERGVRLGIIASSSDEPEDPGAPCQIAALDTLVARKLYPPADFLVFDEAHRAVAPSYAALLGHYSTQRHLLLTATPERGDGVGLREVADELVVGATFRELADLGLLVPLVVRRPAKRLRLNHIAQPIVDCYRQEADGRPCLVFSPSVELAHEHAAAFTMGGYPARAVWGEMPTGARRAAVDAFKAGELRVLTNVACLTEGFDAPAVSCIILARGCSTTGGLDQIIGRGVRIHPGKTECVFLDLVGCTHEHTLPIEGRTYSLDGIGVRGAGERGDVFCKVCGQILEPGEPCPDCGFEPAPTKLVVDAVKLEPYYRRAMANDNADVRMERLVRWIIDARTKGHKVRAAMGRYRGVYGRPPSIKEWQTALLKSHDPPKKLVTKRTRP